MSNKICCIVVEDEPIGREIIETYVHKTPFLELLGSFSKPIKALDFLQEHPLDLLLTDVEMPELNGLELMETLDDKPAVILITAYTQYAIEGFEEGVADYLVKPVSYDRFLKAVLRVKKTLDKKIGQETQSMEEDRIFIKVDGEFVKIILSDIIYIEALKDYIRIHLSGKERYVTHSTMKAMEEQLPDYFYRVQRSYIVNTRRIQSLYGNTLTLSTGKTLPVAAARKEKLYERLGLENA